MVCIAYTFISMAKVALYRIETDDLWSIKKMIFFSNGMEKNLWLPSFAMIHSKSQ